LIDHTGVAAVKRELLELLWDHFRRTHLSVDSPRARIFRRFVIARGELLTAFATFEALDERFRTEGCAGWPNWPAEYRRPQSAAVTRFADERADRLGFFEWIQWECDRQLGRVGQACAAGSLPVGLYQDLAVGVDGSGFESWYWQDVFARDVTVGAPPDDFNLLGQDWGLLPWIPEKLRETGYQPFIDCLRSNMRYAGALRIDHVMGLMRTFWVPNGMQARDGTYVAYPFHDLLGVLALESQRNRCMVIGEDLGTVPDEVRRELAPVSVLSTRLLWFTREADGRFSPPADYPRQSVVATSTHDLPTLAGWWGGDDIRLRTELGLFAEDTQGDRQIAERARDRGLLLEALRDHGLLPEGIDPAEPPDQLTVGLTAAVHRFLARGPAMLALFQFEDVLGQTAQANLPGTTDQHPNWRRRLSVAVEGLADDERVRAVSEALQMERG
jgi:(1->4)-alpha-D-glucan 1-alpha-D-glucosylmutase